MIRNDSDAMRRYSEDSSALGCSLFSYLCWGIVFSVDSQNYIDDFEYKWGLIEQQISRPGIFKR